MKKLTNKVASLIVCMITLFAVQVYADKEYDARMERIAKWRDEEYARSQQLKCLELQTRILAYELELQRGVTNVTNYTKQNNVNSSSSSANVDIDESTGVASTIDSTIKNK